MIKTGRRLRGKAIDDALDPVFEVDFAEVDQQSQKPLAQAQLRQHLFAVHRSQLLHRFQFHDHLVLDQQVGTKAFIEFQFVVPDPNGHLALDLQALFAQLMGEDHLVNCFEQSRTAFGVHPEGCIENDFGKLIFSVIGLGVCIHGKKALAGGAAWASIASGKPGWD